MSMVGSLSYSTLVSCEHLWGVLVVADHFGPWITLDPLLRDHSKFTKSLLIICIAYQVFVKIVAYEISS